MGDPITYDRANLLTNFGQYRHPAWYHNLRADPAAEVVVDGVRRAVQATEATDAQRERIWQEALRVYPGFWAVRAPVGPPADLGVYLGAALNE
jgi:deazaflavin-dependent oxidoreductase (nitroreductase family)